MPTIEESLGQLIADHKAEILQKAVDKVAVRLAKTCLPDAERQFRAGIEAAIRQRADKLVAGLDVMTFYETDSYGQRRNNDGGKTLVELFAHTVRTYLSESVDSEGRSSNSYGSRDRTRLQHMVADLAKKAVEKDLHPAIEQAKNDFRQQIAGKLATVFRDTLAAAMKS